MRSVTLPPRPELRPYVQLIWCLEVDRPADFGPPERIAPDGIVELVVHYRGGTSVRFAGSATSAMPSSSLVCQSSRHLEVAPLAASGFVSVRFLPWGALHFFDLPVDEFGDRVVSAHEAWPGDRGELHERVAGARGQSERVDVVESYLLERLARCRKDDVEGAVRAVWHRRGTVPVRELCRSLGVSERTAQRLFRRSVGMPPKRYARLVRFLHACAQIRSAQWRSLSEVGHRCGYYDQAHLDRDFKAFSGMSPSEFAADARVSFLEIE